MNDLRRLMEMREKQQIEAGMGAMNAMKAIPYEPPTLKQTLTDRRDVLLHELGKIEEALRLFESEPRVTDAIETIMKAMR